MDKQGETEEESHSGPTGNDNAGRSLDQRSTKRANPDYALKTIATIRNRPGHQNILQKGKPEET